MLLIAAVLVLSLIGFGIVAVCTARQNDVHASLYALLMVLAALLNTFAIRRLVNNRGHPKNCKEKPANRKFGHRD